jgi:cation diffusion facilitator CzcD-associated flavoprotein CzcO
MRVCILGAGASGLVAAKKLLDQGLSPTVFERNAGPGGNWLYGAPGSSVYRSTHLISSKRLTQFRDFPMPAEWPPYIRHDQALEYLRRYAGHFDLPRHIRFGVEVTRCEREEDGRWRVSTSEGEEKFNALVVASGHHREPAMPAFAGQFEGSLRECQSIDLQIDFHYWSRLRHRPGDGVALRPARMARGRG